LGFSVKKATLVWVRLRYSVVVVFKGRSSLRAYFQASCQPEPLFLFGELTGINIKKTMKGK
jgi:hypothetical protein